MKNNNYINNKDYIENIKYYLVANDPFKVVLTSVFQSEDSYEEKYLATVESKEELNAILSKMQEDGFQYLVESLEGYEKHIPLRGKRLGIFQG